MSKLLPFTLLAVLVAALAVAGCGGQKVAADEVPGAPVALQVPEVTKGGSDALAGNSSSSSSSLEQPELSGLRQRGGHRHGDPDGQRADRHQRDDPERQHRRHVGHHAAADPDPAGHTARTASRRAAATRSTTSARTTPAPAEVRSRDRLPAGQNGGWVGGRVRTPCGVRWNVPGLGCGNPVPHSDTNLHHPRGPRAARQPNPPSYPAAVSVPAKSIGPCLSGQAATGRTSRQAARRRGRCSPGAPLSCSNPRPSQARPARSPRRIASGRPSARWRARHGR